MTLLLWSWMAVAADPCPPTVAQLAQPPDPRLGGPKVIVLQKSLRRLCLYEHGALSVVDGVAGAWPVGTGGVEGPKRRQGDRRTPEGWYRTADKPASQFAGAIRIDYPNADDARAALADGVIDAATARRIEAASAAGTQPPQDTPMGGLILFHGGGASTDWTLGCVALDDADRDALRARLGTGQRAWALLLP
jgi:murein L,D-transpeptidase YafK